MRIVWCTLQFLDYRIPVFEELSKQDGVELFLVFNGEVNSDRIIKKAKKALGDKAIPLYGEISIGKANNESFANSGFRLPYQKGLIKTIKRLNPDVMVSDGFFQWSYATIYLRASRKIPHVMCYERTMHTERNAQKIRTIYRKQMLKWIDSICCSGKLCEEYVKHLGFNKPTFRGFMVADTELIKAKLDQKKVGFDSDENVINYLFVGRVIELKGLNELIESWIKFSQDKSDVRLTIAGTGDLEDDIKFRIKKENIQKIRLLGKVPYDEVPELYKSSDIFILPTLEDNWSLVVPEAMTAGLPIITSFYNGCYPELVTKENGWVMNPLNSDNFLETLNKSYRSREELKKMGEASKNIIKDHTPQTAAKSIYEACLTVLEKEN